MWRRDLNRALPFMVFGHSRGLVEHMRRDFPMFGPQFALALDAAYIATLRSQAECRSGAALACAACA